MSVVHFPKLEELELRKSSKFFLERIINKTVIVIYNDLIDNVKDIRHNFYHRMINLYNQKISST